MPNIRGPIRGELMLQICHDSRAHILYVSVVKARHLRTAGDDKPLNPYAQCTLLPGTRERNTRRTRQIPNTSDPKWNQTMVYPGVRRDQLHNHWLLASVWSLAVEDHTVAPCPQDYDDFLGEVAVDLGRDTDEQERWYPLAVKATKPKRHLTIMETPACSSSSLGTAAPSGSSYQQPAPCLSATGNKWHAYPKSVTRRRSVQADVSDKVRGRGPTLPSSYITVNPLLPRGPVGIGGAAFGRYASVSCPVS